MPSVVADARVLAVDPPSRPTYSDVWYIKVLGGKLNRLGVLLGSTDQDFGVEWTKRARLGASAFKFLGDRASAVDV